jgi:hypothetical protein
MAALICRSAESSLVVSLSGGTLTEIHPLTVACYIFLCSVARNAAVGAAARARAPAVGAPGSPSDAPRPEELHDLLGGRKLIQWPIATPVHLPASLAAGDARRGVIEASTRDRDGHEGQAGIGVAEIELHVRRMVLEGFLQAQQGLVSDRGGA